MRIIIMKILHLNLKKEYFFGIKNGDKPFEFRLNNPYWQKRLIDRDYEQVWFKLGYPKADDKEKIVKREYLGFERQDISHKHFGEDEVGVFAIYTNGKDIEEV